MEAWKEKEQTKPGVDEWSWHLGGDSVETAGGLSKDLEHDSHRVGSEEMGGCPGSGLVSGSPAKGLLVGS